MCAVSYLEKLFVLRMADCGIFVLFNGVWLASSMLLTYVRFLRAGFPAANVNHGIESIDRHVVNHEFR